MLLENKELPPYAVTINIGGFPILLLSSNGGMASSMIKDDPDYIIWREVLKDAIERLQKFSEPETPPSGV